MASPVCARVRRIAVQRKTLLDRRNVYPRRIITGYFKTDRKPLTSIPLTAVSGRVLPRDKLEVGYAITGIGIVKDQPLVRAAVRAVHRELSAVSQRRVF